MSSDHKIYIEFPGRILFVGFGSIGQGVLPLLLRHVGITPDRLTIVTAEDNGSEEAAKYGIKFIKERLTRENFRRVLGPLLGRGDFLINVSLEVSSVALIKLCWEKGAMYLDTCIEPWPGGYTDPTVPAARRTNYALREEPLALSEGSQPSEMGWGTHERNFPRDGKRHDSGSLASIYLMQPGAGTRVRTWTPRAGHFHGFCITHAESISIADYFTVREGSQVAYRPTVHYAYHPCAAAVMSIHELAGRNYVQQERQRILMDDIVSGIDELGVLLAGHKKNAYWYGSQLSIGEARQLAPYNNATSLQVCVAVLSGVVWAMENPNLGVVEPDEMDFRRNLEICTPYLGPMVGEYTDWTPLHERERLFPEDIDRNDPWQFKNVRVIW